MRRGSGLVLALCAGGLHATARKMQWHFRKLPLSLQKPFVDLVERKLYPNRGVKKNRLTNEDMLSDLATEDNLMGYLEAESVAPEAPRR